MSKEKLNVVVTGSDGFIASHTIQELHGRGYQVIGLERHHDHSRHPEDARPDMVYQGDLRDKNLVERVVSSSDAVLALAGILGTKETVNNPFPSIEVNIMGNLNVLEACKIWNVPLVYIGVGNHWMNNSYSITKTTAERFVLMYANEHGVKGNVVRALNAFGERQLSYPIRKITPNFVLRALRNEDIMVYGSGNQKMDMIYVKDVATVLVDVLMDKCVMGKEVGKIYQAGTGKEPTVNEIAEAVIRLSGSKSKLQHVPMRPGEEKESVVVADNPYPLKRGYMGLDEALLRTIEFYKANFDAYIWPDHIK